MAGQPCGWGYARHYLVRRKSRASLGRTPGKRSANKVESCEGIFAAREGRRQFFDLAVANRGPSGLSRRRRSPQQVSRFYAELAREPIDNVDAGGIDTPFDRADIGAVDLCPMRALLLRQLRGVAVPSHGEVQRLSSLPA